MMRNNLKYYLLELTASFLSNIIRRELFSRKPSAKPAGGLRGPLGPKRSVDHPPSGGV